MIGKLSALKGFGLFFCAVIVICTLICATFAGAFGWICGILNLGLGSYVIVKQYKEWNKEGKEEK